MMNIDAISTLEQAESFLQGTGEVSFQRLSQQESYQWLQRTLHNFAYHTLPRAQKGLLRSYMSKVTGYSKSQLTRLINKHRRAGRITCKQYKRHSFSKKYTNSDIMLLAQTDKLHDVLSGPATKKLFERAYNIFDQKEYIRLANISVAHIYNLRKTTTYIKNNRRFTKTNPNRSVIGERRKPQPNGKPGFIRIDTVHQGDYDKQKGVYHINAVDEVTQFEVVFSVEKISEAYLIPIIKLLLDSFPFEIINFHSDNGSEYINATVAKLLNKLLIEFTKSRARHTNDNALVESKNAAIVRKYIGYGHISQKWANKLNQFNKDYLNPYVNYHRPCFFPRIEIDKKGKEKKKYLYEDMMTPYEKLRSLKNSRSYLKAGISFEELEAIAHNVTDHEAAELMQAARRKLFAEIHGK